ncbi:GrpB family protein [Halocalculus aciditolerans]|uniref:GrpB family protein n=1 Tax=Halocalculus aciditolerans TaxID=1383812 RepID=A0A830FC89_9EURY|nr:GrpB family protein [Halocalculus aciditolerans]GGL61130.1 hypothetical protein GCM10009039_19110 [Halocalculus aciditolerans]
MVGLARGTVELEPYDESWVAVYEREAERLDALVGEAVEAFAHVGSTAIPGLPAKPIIDLLAVVPDREAGERVANTLIEHGYERRPNDDVDGRIFLARGPPSNRTHYLSVVTPDSDCYREQLAFRDSLRAHPDVRDAYADLKRDLAAEHGDDRATYTAAKSEFVESVLDDALD